MSGDALSPSEKALEGVRGALKELGQLSSSTYRLTRGFVPLLKLVTSEADITERELSEAIDTAFAELYRHPLTRSTGRFTSYLRSKHLLPNEQSTEQLIRFLVQQVIQRSPVAIPEVLVQEFWHFFDELFSTPELKGIGELSFDMARLVLRTYEPMLVDVLNLLKQSRRYNEQQTRQLIERVNLLRHDLEIVRRQIRALRYIKPFFLTDPKDFKTQAQIIAQMVREFGPFFIKMAQAASANANFLPEEIGRELAVFQEDVAPMSEAEVRQAFLECYGAPPDKLFMEFDADKPLRSGSIGSVYLAKKPFVEGGREVLREVIIKVGRHNLDREFTMGKMVLGLAILSSQLWAPHGKLEPFLRAMQRQVDEFVTGFLEELNFEDEAENHLRFFERSLRTRAFRVPVLYRYAHRILEMEYLNDAASLTRAVAKVSPRKLRRFQARVSERLLYAIVNQLVLYGELHGDLHPGNIMVTPDGQLYLIDWGNVVRFEGKWSLIADYVVAVLRADTELMVDTLVAMASDPDEARSRRDEIKHRLDELLRKKGVAPLTRRNVLSELRRGGVDGLVQRVRTVLQMMTNTAQYGVVLSREYLHLSRALVAAAGSFSSLYATSSKRRLGSDVARDVARAVIRMPWHLARDLVRRPRFSVREYQARR